MKFESALAAATAALAMLCSGASAQSTWWVDVNGHAPGTGTYEDPYTSIHYAVQQPTTLSGDLVLVQPGVYPETVEIVHKNLTLRSLAGPDETVIAAGGHGTVLTVIGSPAGGGSVTVEGFGLTGGSGTWRAGPELGASVLAPLPAVQASLRENARGDVLMGGGLLAEGVELYLNRMSLRENRAWLGGGLAADAAAIHLFDCSIRENFAELEPWAANGKGGGIYLRHASRATLSRVLVDGNLAGVGGGLFAEGSSLELDDSQVLKNLAWGGAFDGLAVQGGGLYAESSDVEVYGSRFVDNQAFGPDAKGGGLRFAVAGSAELEASWITDNWVGVWCDGTEQAPALGGGIASDVQLYAYDLELLRNHAEHGGGVYGVGSFDDCHLGWNQALLGGGAYGSSYEGACTYGGLILTRSAIRENEAWGMDGSGGGGVFGPALVDHSRVFGNFALGDGGGVSHASVFFSEVHGNRVLAEWDGQVVRGAGAFGSHVESSILRDNFAEAIGGSAYGGGASDSYLVLTQVYDNESQFGGGAHDSLVDRVTVHGNAAPLGGAGLYFDWQGYVASSIVWGNLGEQIADVYGVAVVWTNVQGGWPGLGNMNQDPMFWNAPAADFHLKPGSPCIDHGDPGGYDPDGTRCDQGALPYDHRLSAQRAPNRQPMVPGMKVL